ncbi:MAG: 3-phosphoserine/phosphohydroxythreonine transaminase [Treponemataceae bacterium]|nr:MAG: 3-phosphoserine/phosphohydroxythreonine transaminase [Treponemataceae bacterium]
MSRVYNFAAGPSCLPAEVLEEAARELPEYGNSGQSVMEMSHRSKEYEAIIGETESLVRQVMGVPDSYKVLFLQGGASQQFACVPLNLTKAGKAAYVDTGVWAKKAYEEAARFTKAEIVASSADRTYTYIPSVPKLEDNSFDYLHITLNNTIMGTKWKILPDCGNMPLVADISSCILSEPIDVGKFALLYAGAQKNLGPAGVTLVLIREDMFERAPLACTPTMLMYKIHAENGSMYNTPPCYTVYIVGKVLKWVQKNGGAEGMKKRNTEKARMLYDYLDASDFYRSPVEKDSRSLMNIPFVTRESDAQKAEAINKAFVSQAAKAGLVNLAGHRLVGGMRASLYNAMGIDGVKTLIAFMEEFARMNRGQGIA